MGGSDVLLTIDQSDDRPLYRQLAASVRGAILAGDLSPGDALPPTREVAAALGINPETAQRAYRLLSEEEVVVARVGRGTRVRDDVDPRGLALEEAIDNLVALGSRLGLDRSQLAAMIIDR